MNNWSKFIGEQNKKLQSAFDNCVTIHELFVAKNSLIGKKSKLNQLFANFSSKEKKTTNQDWTLFKKEVIAKFNQAGTRINKNVENKLLFVNKLDAKIKNENWTNIVGVNPQIKLIGSPHPLALLTKKVHQFFQKFQFIYELAPQIETVKNNFDLLNVDKNHPSRLASDTFYLNDETILRTHATNFTARQLLKFAEKKEKNFSYHIGNVFRNDTDDATHNQQFLQLDCCMIGENLNLSHLKWFLRELLIFLFDSKLKIRFRLNDFPFTKPSIELDIWSQTKSEWLEVLGAGVIRSTVLKACKINDPKITVLAFGVGLDRLAMILYRIDDIRWIYQNKLIVAN